MATGREWIETAQGYTIASAIRNGAIGWFLALGASFITGTEAVFNLLIQPLGALADVAERSISTVLGEPISIVPTGFDITADALDGFGLLAGPGALGIMIVSFAIIIWYLRVERTPDWIFIPGIPDLPTDWAGVDEDEK